jgi:hypothetical protein
MRDTPAAALAVLVLCAAIAPIASYSQNAPTGSPAPAAATQSAQPESESVPAPFPSRLRVAAKGEKVVLSWIDSPDVKAGYAIFRHTEALNMANISLATRVGRVEAGVQTFSDSPTEGGSYYYAVLALSEDGTLFQVVIPARNATTAPLAVAPPPPKPTYVVEGLKAEAKGESIVLSYKALAPSAKLVVYRGQAQMARASDLLEASLVTTFTDRDGSFIDYPVPGVEYWYALIGEEDFKAGKIELVPGKNSTTASARIAAASYASPISSISPASRTPPLPALLFDASAALPGYGIQGPTASVAAKPVSPETGKAIVPLMSYTPSIEVTRPAVTLLNEEKSPPSGAEDYALALIVTEKLAKGDSSGAVTQLRKYLSLDRGEAVRVRARFYLGQALALTGSFREAFFELLVVRSTYARETKAWFDYTLSMLHEN